MSACPVSSGADAARHKAVTIGGYHAAVLTISASHSNWRIIYEIRINPTIYRMHHPEFPEPMGIFRCVERPTYEDMLMGQVNTATKAKGPGRLEDLYDDGETWQVN